jgi:hypothetical protein
MNTIYNELSKEFGIVKPLSTKEIVANVEAYSLLSKEEKDNLIINSRRPNRQGFILD